MHRFDPIPKVKPVKAFVKSRVLNTAREKQTKKAINPVTARKFRQQKKTRETLKALELTTR